MFWNIVKISLNSSYLISNIFCKFVFFTEWTCPYPLYFAEGQREVIHVKIAEVKLTPGHKVTTNKDHVVWTHKLNVLMD